MGVVGELTAKQAHRAGLEARGDKRVCVAKPLGGCGGRLQADHAIEARHLIAERDKKIVAYALHHAEHPLVFVDVDDLLADSRNAIWLCADHNANKGIAMVRLERSVLPASVEEFAAEYEIENLLERWFK